MWDKSTEIRWNIFGGLGFRESKQMQTYSIKWNYSSNYAGVLLCKSSPCTKHKWHCTIRFLLILLPWMFISSYTTIYFFCKEFSFSNAYISVNMILECSYLCFYSELGYPLSTNTAGGMEGIGLIKNMYRCLQGQRGIMCHEYVRIYTLYFHFPVLWYLVSFVKNWAYLHSKKVFLWEMVVFLQWDPYLLPWNILFYYKLFFQTKVSHYALNFNQIKS